MQLIYLNKFVGLLSGTAEPAIAVTFLTLPPSTLALLVGQLRLYGGKKMTKISRLTFSLL